MIAAGFAAALAGGHLAAVAEDKVQAVRESAQIQSFQRQLMEIPAFANQVTGKKVVLARMSKFQEATSDNQGEEIIESLHYRYDDGKTLRVRMSAKSRALVGKVEVEEAYPTPLAPEETARALALAREKSPPIEELFRTKGEAALIVSFLAPVISDPKHPLYGQRLAIIQVIPKKEPEKGANITINLTKETVANL
jgi:hypothetical protein